MTETGAASPRIHSRVKALPGRRPGTQRRCCHTLMRCLRIMGYRSTNKTVYSAKYHVIWCPKYRRRVHVDGVEQRLKPIAGEPAG